MRADAPEIVLQYTEFGETRSVPFPRFYLRDDRAFFDFCADNAHSTLRFEREADGEVRLMPPSGSETSWVNGRIFFALSRWNEDNGEPGYVFESSSGFVLTNGAVRAPDVSYVEKSRYEALTDEQRAHYPPLAPDFVVEVMSPSDRLRVLQSKMEEYRDNGVPLGWLLDRKNRSVYVYRPGMATEVLTEPTQISAEPELPGFTLDARRLF
jgi:Uma2 family endonuclease